MIILDKKGLSGITKIILDVIFLGGIAILISLPYTLGWYMQMIYRTNTENYLFLLVFLYISGIFCLVLVYEMRKIFKTLNNKDPFVRGNVKSLNRVGLCCFVIAAAYIIKIFCYNSVLTAIITLVFIIAGIFAVVLAEVFRQAIIVKEENDLTI